MCYAGHRGAIGYSNEAPEEIINLIKLRNELHQKLFEYKWQLGANFDGNGSAIDLAFEKLDDLLTKL